MTDSQRYLGLDIGGTGLKAVICDAGGKVLERDSRPTADNGTDAWLKQIPGWVRELSRSAPAGIGVAAPGLASADGRRISSMPARLAGLQGLDWPSFLDLPMPVHVLNDAHAALLGEAWCGAARGASNVILLTLGTGVGGAAMVDGRLLRGHLGRAGHLGHVSLDPHGPGDIVNTPGSLEQCIGECSLPERTGGRFGTTRQLLAAAAAGDVVAQAVWDRSVQALAAAIAGLINVLDPQVVLLAGGIAQCGEPLLRPLAAWLDRFEWRPGGANADVKCGLLGVDAGGVGAARFAELCGPMPPPFTVEKST